jgi:CHAT domain-containing protein
VPDSVLRAPEHEWTFAKLPATRDEVGVIAEYWKDAFGAESARVLEGSFASRESFETLAPRARTIHLATHGYIAPQSVRSMADPRPHVAPGGFDGGQDQVIGLAPMVLSGLAFAGANGAPDLFGRVAGVMTAEELASLDLSGCELAVLSACETNVGVRRGGQGIASLQQALMAAGVRTAVTSLWKVPDEATRELMVDFYRRLWVQKKPKAQALWEAKQMLRRKLDAGGKPVHATRDWAAWVLSGEPE